MNAFVSWLMPVGRVLIAIMFIMSGLQKMGSIEGTAGYIASVGLPGFLVYPTILLEVVGGLAVLIGYQTRIAALLLAGFTVLAGLLFHFQPDNQMQMISFMKNLSIAGGFLFLVAYGAGRLSVDARLGNAG